MTVFGDPYDRILTVINIMTWLMIIFITDLRYTKRQNVLKDSPIGYGVFLDWHRTLIINRFAQFFMIKFIVCKKNSCKRSYISVFFCTFVISVWSPLICGYTTKSSEVPQTKNRYNHFVYNVLLYCRNLVVTLSNLQIVCNFKAKTQILKKYIVWQ